jgi:hypothetical protein
MKPYIRLVVLLFAMSFLFFAMTPTSFAASQTITAQITSNSTTGFLLSMNWSAVTGVDHYNVHTANDPNVTSADTLWATVTTNSLNQTMTSTVGYRYFRVYAYDSAGALLAYSNVVGVAKYTSGLVVKMKQDSALTSTYPDPAGSPNPTYYQKPVWFITVDSTIRNSNVAPNFQMGEFISQTSLTSALVDPKLVEHCQNARNRYGVMVVNSGYRTPAYNQSLGGATYSRHMYGDAVDIDANTQSEYDALVNVFAPENPDYVEPYSLGGYNHYHGDWRYEAKGYQNW